MLKNVHKGDHQQETQTASYSGATNVRKQNLVPGSETLVNDDSTQPKPLGRWGSLPFCPGMAGHKPKTMAVGILFGIYQYFVLPVGDTVASVFDLLLEKNFELFGGK